MEVYNIKDMVKGWFIGNFEPTLFKSDDVEVALKEYAVGDFEEQHFHKIATEYTVIVSGEVEMNGINYKEGSIIVIKPNEVTDFKALTSVKTLVVKLPGARNDKFTL